jgi:hypothetical protein
MAIESESANCAGPVYSSAMFAILPGSRSRASARRNHALVEARGCTLDSGKAGATGPHLCTRVRDDHRPGDSGGTFTQRIAHERALRRNKSTYCESETGEIGSLVYVVESDTMLLTRDRIDDTDELLDETREDTYSESWPRFS